MAATGLLGASVFALLAVSTGSAAAAPTASPSAGCKHANAVARSISTRKAEKSVLCLVNKARAKRKLKTAKNQGKLRRAAVKHSRYENRANCIAHQCPGEASFKGRLKREGYPGCNCRWSAGEAIGWRRGGGATPKGIVSSWLKSASHRAIVLNRRFDEAGVGIAWGSPRAGSPPGQVAGIYTLVMGYRK